MAKKYLIGFLVLAVLASSVYIMLPEHVKLEVQGAKTIFSVYENGKFVVSGTEYNSIFRGTTKARPDASLDKIYNIIEGNNVKIIRERTYSQGEKIIDTYEFDGSLNDIELFPISHKIEIFNAKDKFFRYELKNLINNNPIGNFIDNPISFGRNMKLTYQEENKRWSKLYKSSLAIQYDIPSDYEVYNIRLFDPVSFISFVFPTPNNASTQSATSIPVNVSVTSSLDHYAFVDFDNDLLLWMRMDDTNASGDPTDLSSYSNNGTKQGNATQTSVGYFGKGFSFDSDGDYIDLGTSSLSAKKSQFTISSWFKVTTSAASGSLTIYGESAYEGVGVDPWGLLMFYVDLNDGSINAYVYKDGDGTSPSITSAVNADDGLWHNAVFVKENSTSWELYFDGASVGTSSLSQTTSMLIDDVRIGSVDFDQPYYMNGTIDDVMIFNRSLNVNEIQSLYNASAYQYEHNFTDLAEDTYAFTGYAVDILGNKNQTEEREVTISFSFLDLLVEFSNGIYDLIFNPRRLTDQDVWAVNQTTTKGVFNLTNNGTLISNINIRFNQTQTGWEMECNNKTTGNWINLTTSWQRIYSSLGVGSSQMIWCRVDLNYPESAWSGQVEFNATEV